MSTTACPRCEKQVPTDQLIPYLGKRICLECESDIEETKRMRSSVYRSIASLPVIGGTAFLTLCIPFVGVYVSGLLAAFTIVAAVQGIRLGMSIRQDPSEYGVGDTEPIILMVLGVLTGVWGLGLTGFDLLIIVASFFVVPSGY